MKRFILPFLALFAISAPAEWHYDPEGRNLAQGDVELWNVTANGKALAIGENACNSTASEVDLSTGVADGWTVVRIERDAFAGHPTLSRVVFPDTLESIGDSAFAFCSNLACSVSLPASLRGALDRTFSGSPVTGDVVVPDGVTSMVETFRGTRITSLVCGTGLEEVRGCDGLCAGCTALTNVEFRRAARSAPSSSPAARRCAASRCIPGWAASGPRRSAAARRSAATSSCPAA